MRQAFLERQLLSQLSLLATSKQAHPVFEFTTLARSA